MLTLFIETMKNFKRSHIVGFGLVWVLLISLGIGALERYTLTPGKLGSVPTAWPPNSKLQHSFNSTLMVFLHPECACSEATVTELGKLLTRVPKTTVVYAVFVQPKGWSEIDVKSDLWQRVEKIPNVHLVLDKDRSEANVFGALTSGHTLLYGKDGQLAFSGGITGARGHEGDNEGEEKVVAILNNDNPAQLAQTKIFGCELFEQ